MIREGQQAGVTQKYYNGKKYTMEKNFGLHPAGFPLCTSGE